MKYVCTICRVEKDRAEFYTDKRNTVKGVASKCKDCARALQKKINRARGYKPEDRVRAKLWREKNHEKCLQQERARRERNLDSYRASVRKWVKENPDKHRMHRVLKRTRIPKWAEREKIKVVYQKSKQYGFDVDHIVPLQHPLVCGLHVWANLQLLDKSTNSAKSNREWPDMPDRALSAARLQAMTS